MGNDEKDNLPNLNEQESDKADPDLVSYVEKGFTPKEEVDTFSKEK